jgi:hypothetical protein
MIRKTILMAGILLIALCVTAVQAAVVRSTAYGNGADATVSNDNQSSAWWPSATHGTNLPTSTNWTYLGMRNIAGTRQRIAYLRFDLSEVAGDMSGASLSMTADFLKGGTKAINIYGLKDGSDDNWVESAICYDNAPGMLPPTPAYGNYTIDPAKLTLQGTITFPALTDPVNYPIVFSSTDPNILGGLPAGDKNKLMTLVLIAAGDSEDTASSKENTATPPNMAPTLILPNANLGGGTTPFPTDNSMVDVNFKNGTYLRRLSWAAAEGCTKWDVWFGPADANALDYQTKLIKVQTNSNKRYYNIPTTLTSGLIYTWVVNGYNGTTLPPDPNVPGVIWRFTATSLPIITAQPVEQIKFAAEQAVFAVTAEASTVPITSFVWYRSPDNANNTPTGDVEVPGDVEVLGAVASSTLTLTVAPTDEGYYYCKVYNGGPAVVSNAVRLVVKRQLAHWTLDNDFQGWDGTYYLDETPIAIDPVPQNADPNGTGIPGFVANVNGTPSSAVTITTGTGWATVGAFNPTAISNEFTLSMWVKWAGPNAAYQGLLSKTDGWDAANNMWQLEIQLPAANNVIHFKRFGGNTVTMPVLTGGTAALPIGEWAFVAVTVDGTNATIYRLTNVITTRTDAIRSVTSAFVPGTGTVTGATFRIGSVAGATAFNGIIDDVQVFNYAKDARGIVDLHNEVQVGNFCVDTYGTAQDYNGTCKVELADLATFAAQWLSCGLYPNCL